MTTVVERGVEFERRERMLAATLAGESPAIRRLRRSLARVAPYPTTVLLTGETGAGKGEAARALHRVSPRSDGPFVHVDCAGLSDSLLSAELWGVARGGFTGADSSRAGRFELAEGGTLLLDEVGELSLSGQKKLLRVLEEGCFERIGETRSRRLDARVVAATNVDLERAVAAGSFRADLYYRLRVFVVDLPPLRARREDVGCWLEVAVQRASSRLQCPEPRISPAALEHLAQHDWPGNFREFLNVIESAVVHAGDEEIDAELIDELIAPSRTLETPRADPTRSRCAEDVRDDLGAAIDAAGGNLSLAARRLGMPRSTLRYRMGLDDVAGRRGRMEFGTGPAQP